MKFQVVAAFFVICILSLEGIRAAPSNVGSFNGNNVGGGIINDNGNSGNFDGNSAGDNSFDNNGNSNSGPIVWY